MRPPTPHTGDHALPDPGGHGHDATAGADHGAEGGSGPDHVHRRDDHAHAHAHPHRRGPAGVLLSLVSPRDHSAHGSDRVLESTAEGIRAVFVSLAALAATAAVELVVALASHSVALLADTIHNFADALTAVPLALAFRMGRRPPTRRYTYGFGRAEDLAGVAIVAMIAASTVVAAYEAVQRLVHPHAVSGPGWVMAAGAVGFAGNEIVAEYRMRVGRRIGSGALVADGLHARSDGFTSLAVMMGAIASAAGAPVGDPVAGLVITGAVAVVLLGALRTVYRRLMDSVDPELVDQIEAVLHEAPGVDVVRSVRVRWVGHSLRAEIRIESDPALTLVDAHAIAEEAHHRLLHQVPRLAEAVIHSSPTEGDGRRFHQALSHHFPRDEQAAAQPATHDASSPAPRVAPGATGVLDRSAHGPGVAGAGYTAPSVSPHDQQHGVGTVVVEEVSSVTPDVVAALQDLVPELSSSAPPLDADAVEQIARSPATALLVARDGTGGRVLGSLTLVVFSAPTGPRAWIEDVVVAPAARGRGVGAALVHDALTRARAAGSRTVDLTSRPSREAANRLYQRLGFATRQTNVYRRDLTT